MKLSVTLLLVVLGMASAIAWPIKPDDKEQRIREAEEIASKNLETFKDAVAKQWPGKMAELTLDVIPYLEEAQGNNRKLNKLLAPVITVLNKLANPSRGPLAPPINFLKLRALQLLSNLIDGNRDNLSYYRLDAIRMWIERRTGDDGAKDVQELKDAGKAVVAARDALEAMASTFVAGLKEIKEETRHILHEDHARIKAIAGKILQTANDNKDVLISKTDETEKLLKAAVARYFEGEVVTPTICIFPPMHTSADDKEDGRPKPVICPLFKPPATEASV